VLKPYGLQSIGITLAVLSLVGVVSSLVTGVVRMVAVAKQERISRGRVGATLGVAAALLAGICLIPIPWYASSPFVVEATDARHAYVLTPGFVEEVRVKAGDRVEAGDVLVVLKNPELSDRLRENDLLVRVQDQRIKTAKALADLKEIETAERDRAALVSQREDLDRQAKELTIVAPIAGVVLPPPRIEEAKYDVSANELPHWHGTPLEESNRDLWLPTQTQLLSIAPSDERQAVVLFDQALRNDIRERSSVKLKANHLADTTFRGHIERISSRHLEFSPPSLSNKYGGPLSTVTDARGTERLTSIAYEAIVPLPGAASRLIPGTRGEARILIDRRSLGGWIWHGISQLFFWRL
jgi:putative peptide zinc metalloprotease protein